MTIWLITSFVFPRVRITVYHLPSQITGYSLLVSIIHREMYKNPPGHLLNQDRRFPVYMCLCCRTYVV